MALIGAVKGRGYSPSLIDAFEKHGRTWTGWSFGVREEIRAILGDYVDRDEKFNLYFYISGGADKRGSKLVEYRLLVDQYRYSAKISRAPEPAICCKSDSQYFGRTWFHLRECERLSPSLPLSSFTRWNTMNKEARALQSAFEYVYDIERTDTVAPRARDNEREQEELAEKMSKEISFDASKRNEIIQELRSLTPQSAEIIEYKGQTYKRDNKTIAQLKILRHFKCQICDSNILKKDGSLYVEAAHIKRKSEKGTEMPNNILILCPNHHKEFDLGNKKIIAQTDKGISFDLNGKRYDLRLNLG